MLGLLAVLSAASVVEHRDHEPRHVCTGRAHHAHTLFSRALVDTLSASAAPKDQIPQTAERLTDHALYEGEFVYDGIR